ncbi:hypothetical protein GCM10018953_37220 [Streptosporangium nondiastaticum]
MLQKTDDGPAGRGEAARFRDGLADHSGPVGHDRLPGSGAACRNGDEPVTSGGRPGCRRGAAGRRRAQRLN